MKGDHFGAFQIQWTCDKQVSSLDQESSGCRICRILRFCVGKEDLPLKPLDVEGDELGLGLALMQRPNVHIEAGSPFWDTATPLTVESGPTFFTEQW